VLNNNEEETVGAAHESHDVAMSKYSAGTTDYLQVISSQAWKSDAAPSMPIYRCHFRTACIKAVLRSPRRS
jgi:hypothetical protein